MCGVVSGACGGLTLLTLRHADINPPAAPNLFPHLPLPLPLLQTPRVKILYFAFLDWVRFMVQQISYPSKCGCYVQRSSTFNEGAREESRLSITLPRDTQTQ